MDELKLSTSETFLHLLRDKKKILVTSHNNPDPDSLASCLGAKRLLSHSLPSAQVIIGYSGIIGRVENKSMIEECQIPLTPFSQINQEDFDALILLDCQYPQKNHSLNRIPTVVIDHHPKREAPSKIELNDIREDYGSTSTIIYTYFEELKVPIDPTLATALLYGLKTDTMELARSNLRLEYDIYIELMELADKNKLSRIIHAPVSKVYFLTFKEAIEKAFLLGDKVLIVPQNNVENPDINAEIAEFFMRLEKINWVISMAFWEGELYLSVRSRGPSMEAGEMIQSALADIGAAGGHGRSAGGKIPLLDPSPESRKELRKRVIQKIADYFKLDPREDRMKLIHLA